MIKPWLIFVTVLPLLALQLGCATSTYQPLGMTGGYRDTQLDANTVRVTYYGNVSMSSETVQNFLLYRCAQVTLKYGYDYFIMITGNTREQTSAINTPGTLMTYGGNKGSSYGYYIPGQTIYSSRDISSAIIKMYKGSKPANMSGAFNARDILKYLGPVIPTGKTSR